MAIDFHPDVVAVRLKQIESARKGKSVQSSSADDKASLNDAILSASTTIYNLHGEVGLSTNKPSTLLDTYLETQKVIVENMTLLKSNILGPLQLGMNQSVAATGRSEYWSKENTARRIFSIALMNYNEDVDQEQFADQATAMIKQAYIDIEFRLGIEFPEPALDIRQAVLDAMELLKDGIALSEIFFE